jgi:hypothetical protein
LGKLRSSSWRTRGKQSARLRWWFGAGASQGITQPAISQSALPKGPLHMIIIDSNTGIVAQINVFTVPQGNQQALIDVLAEAARFASTTPGWISSSLHRSLDGTRVVNYAQSESLEAAERIILRL